MLTDWARQMLKQVRRWLPERAIVIVGDSAFAVLELLAAARQLAHPVYWVTRLRLDALPCLPIICNFNSPLSYRRRHGMPNPYPPLSMPLPWSVVRCGLPDFLSCRLKTLPQKKSPQNCWRFGAIYSAMQRNWIKSSLGDFYETVSDA
jgi:hypothetical protein